MRRIFFPILMILILLPGCSPAAAPPTASPMPTSPTSTPMPTSTHAPSPTPSPSALDEAGLTAGQRAYLASPFGRNTTAWLEAWRDYWATASGTGQPAADLTLVLIPDILDDNVWVPALESTDFPGMIVMPPVYAWGDLTPPPADDLGHSIGDGDGLLFLSKVATRKISSQTGIPAGSTLASREGKYVYVDGEGCVVGKTDEAGKWELAMRIDTEGRLHLGDHIFRLSGIKEYASGEREYRSPKIKGIDIGYSEILPPLPPGARYVEVTYEALNGSKGLEEYWNVDEYYIRFDEGTVDKTFPVHIRSSEDNGKVKDLIDFISFIVGVKGDILSQSITENGIVSIIYDVEDMKYLQ